MTDKTDNLIEPYPSELPGIYRAFQKIQDEFIGEAMTSTNQRLFEMAAHDAFGQAGFLIAIAWDEVWQDGRPAGMFLPNIALMARTDPEEETDHDRLQWEIRKGMADGKPGVIDINTGELKEDPKRKPIY